MSTVPAFTVGASIGHGTRWHIIVPVRGGGQGKTRLHAIEGHPLSGTERRDLTEAMARDTVCAAVGTGASVFVLTADERLPAIAAACGASVIYDRGRGLNSELAAASAALQSAGRSDGSPAASPGVCVALGDLPAVTSADLRTVLERAERDPARGVVVPDEDGVGTTLVAYPSADSHPATFCFGLDSATRHQRIGLHEEGVDLPRLRCDVDTPQAWSRAVDLGLGPSTAALRRRLLGLPPVA